LPARPTQPGAQTAPAMPAPGPAGSLVAVGSHVPDKDRNIRMCTQNAAYEATRRAVTLQCIASAAVAYGGSKSGASFVGVDTTIGPAGRCSGLERHFCGCTGLDKRWAHMPSIPSDPTLNVDLPSTHVKWATAQAASAHDHRDMARHVPHLSLRESPPPRLNFRTVRRHTQRKGTYECATRPCELMRAA